MIGCGYWGPNLLRNLRAQKALRVKTVADSDPKRLAFVKETHLGIGLSQDAAAVLDDPEISVVVIAILAASHGMLVRRALSNGKDVFVEKSLATETEDAAALARLADRDKRLLMI